MKNFFEEAKSIAEKRIILKGLSKSAQMIVKMGEADSINEALKSFYRAEGHEELKTIQQWNKEGKRVKKGEKAMCLWGKPKGKQQEEQSEQSDDYSFFPLCYVFSNLQVQ